MSGQTQKGLGKGFEALIPTDFDTSILTDKNERIQKLAVDMLSPNPQQPRRHFDQTALDELSASIKRFGLLQPLVVSPLDDGRYAIIAGERRWRAAKQANLKTVPAIVRTSEELEQLEIAIVENVQRVDLSPLEQAVSVQRLHEQFNLDYSDIAKRLGKAPSTVQNIARLLQLPKEAQEALREEKITEGHARAILGLRDKDKQLELLQLILDKGWSVRQAERFVTAHKSGAKTSKAAQQRVQTVTPETEKLSKLLNTQVSVKRMAKGGRLEIEFKNETDLKRITKRLSGS